MRKVTYGTSADLVRDETVAADMEATIGDANRSIEKPFSWLDVEEYVPQYEEDMDLEFWRRKKELEEEIRKMKRKGS